MHLSNILEVNLLLISSTLQCLKLNIIHMPTINKIYSQFSLPLRHTMIMVVLIGYDGHDYVSQW